MRDTSQAGPLWRPQICRMAGGAAVYVNESPTPLHHPKFTHFKTIPMEKVQVDRPPTLLTKIAALSKPSVDKAAILSKIQVNRDLLSDAQLRRLDDIHEANFKAFDEDMSKGYQNKEHPYLATFSFR